MTSTHKVPKKASELAAIVFVLPAIYIFGVWLRVFGADDTPAQKIENFTSHFPAAVPGYKWIMGFSLFCCLVSMVLAAKSFKQPLLSLRIAMWITVMVASLIFFVDIFQLL